MARRALLALLLLVAASTGGVTLARAAPPREFLGACYCRAAGTLHCTSNLSQADCRRRCDDAFCDDWFWKERLPCWNWGYGG